MTNNSGAAVAAYLVRHQLNVYVGKIVGRDDPDPALMKPSPYRVRIAVGALRAEPEDCVFIGDTVTDVLAGLLGGVAVIGYANKPGKAQALSQAGARVVVTDLAEITTALRTVPSPALPTRALRCRIEPYLDQGGALDAPRASVSAGLRRWDGPPGTRRSATARLARSDDSCGIQVRCVPSTDPLHIILALRRACSAPGTRSASVIALGKPRCAKPPSWGPHVPLLTSACRAQEGGETDRKKENQAHRGVPDGGGRRR